MNKINSAKEAAKPPLQVLVVDDDVVVRQTLKTYLEELGCRVLEKDSGEGVTDLIEVQAIDAVILDILMDKQEGIQTLSEIRSMFPAINVIMISSDPFYLSITQELGANHVLRKPLDLQELASYLTALK